MKNGFDFIDGQTHDFIFPLPPFSASEAREKQNRRLQFEFHFDLNG